MKKVFALSLLGLALLTGCSNETATPDTTSQGNLQMVPLEGDDTAIWFANIKDGEAYQAAGDLLIHDKTLTVIFSGSSSCPPAIETANIEEGVVSFTLKKPANENMACTADLRPNGWQAELNEEQAGSLAAGRLVSDKAIQPLSFTRIAAEQQLAPVRGR